MRYNAYINERYQEFVIEDENGELITVRPMPHPQHPNPGRDKLMENADNQRAWQQVYDLVNAANEGIVD